MVYQKCTELPDYYHTKEFKSDMESLKGRIGSVLGSLPKSTIAEWEKNSRAPKKRKKSRNVTKKTSLPKRLSLIGENGALQQDWNSARMTKDALGASPIPTVGRSYMPAAFVPVLNTAGETFSSPQHFSSGVPPLQVPLPPIPVQNLLPSMSAVEDAAFSDLSHDVSVLSPPTAPSFLSSCSPQNETILHYNPSPSAPVPVLRSSYHTESSPNPPVQRFSSHASGIFKLPKRAKRQSIPRSISTQEQQ